MSGLTIEAGLTIEESVEDKKKVMDAIGYGLDFYNALTELNIKTLNTQTRYILYHLLVKLSEGDARIELTELESKIKNDL